MISSQITSIKHHAFRNDLMKPLLTIPRSNGPIHDLISWLASTAINAYSNDDGNSPPER